MKLLKFIFNLENLLTQKKKLNKYIIILNKLIHGPFFLANQLLILLQLGTTAGITDKNVRLRRTVHEGTDVNSRHEDER